MAGTDHRTRHPAAFERACELLIMEQGRERVIRQIADGGIDESQAEALVAQAWDASRGDRRREGRTEIARGIAMVAGGLVASVVCFIALSGLGSPIFFVFTGLLLYGAFSIISGVRKLAS